MASKVRVSMKWHYFFIFHLFSLLLFSLFFEFSPLNDSLRAKLWCVSFKVTVEIEEQKRDEFLSLLANQSPYANVTTVRKAPRKRKGKPFCAYRTQLCTFFAFRPPILSPRDDMFLAFPTAIQFVTSTQCKSICQLLLNIFALKKIIPFHFVLPTATEETVSDSSACTNDPIVGMYWIFHFDVWTLNMQWNPDFSKLSIPRPKHYMFTDLPSTYQTNFCFPWRFEK